MASLDGLLEGAVRLEAEDVGFADIELLRLTRWPWLEIRITGRDEEIKQAGVDQLLAFTDRVLHADLTSDGFGLTYDYRLLRAPSIAGMLTIAKWGAAPERRELFLKRCIFCQACVPSGWKFRATKAAMSAFFMIAAPTCKTYLTTDFDLTSGTAVCFEPPDQSEANATADVTAEAALCERSQQVQQGSISCFGNLSSCFSMLRTHKTRPRRKTHEGDNEVLQTAMARIEQLQKDHHDLRNRLEEPPWLSLGTCLPLLWFALFCTALLVCDVPVARAVAALLLATLCCYLVAFATSKKRNVLKM